jgi:predicted small lipoprotein YifL
MTEAKEFDMVQAHITRGATVVALLLALAACGKQEPVPPAPTAVEPTKAVAPLTAAECEKLPDPAPANDSAAGRANAVSAGIAARNECKKAATQSQGDLAKMRQLMEKEAAEREAAKKRSKSMDDAMKEGGARPIRDLKY